MSTLGEKNIADISKDELMAGFAQAGNQKAISANNVPASVLTAPQTQEVAIPQANVPQVDANAAIMGAEQVTGTLQQQETQRTQKEAQQAGQTLSTSEQKLRDTMGVLGTEGAERTKMEESSGLNEARKQLNQLSNQLFNQTANLRQFDVNFTNAMETERLAMGQRGGTKAQFGNFNVEANLQMAVQRSAMVGELYATQSSVQLMQGNIQLAADAVEKALKSFYEPKRQEMQMEMMFFQRNAQLFDKAQDRLAQARMQEIEQEQKQMERAEDAIRSVVEMGYASPEDIQEMMKAETPQEQIAMAHKAYASGAGHARNLQNKALNLDLQIKQAQLNKLTAPEQSGVNWNERANIIKLANDGDPMAIAALGFDPRQKGLTPEQVMENERKQVESRGTISMIDRMLTNSRGIGAITGQFKSPTVSGFFQGGKADNSALSLVGKIPVLGNVIGAVQSRNDRDQILSDLQYLYNTEGFQEFIGLKQSGLSFGALSDGERASIFAAANRLNSAIDLELSTQGVPTGVIKGYRGNEKDLQTDLQALKKGMIAREEEISMRLMLSPDEMQELMSL
jgi:hypothetical protein